MLADLWVSRHSDFVTDCMCLVRKCSCNQPLSSVFAVGFGLLISFVTFCKYSCGSSTIGPAALELGAWIFSGCWMLALGSSRPISSLPPPASSLFWALGCFLTRLSTLNPQLFSQRWVAAVGSSRRDDLRYLRGLL